MNSTDWHLVTNSVAPQQVRETADAYVIEDVPFVKPMELSGGYVPKRSIEETAPLWDGAPATLRHARDASGQPIAANRQPEIHLGIAEDPTFDGEFVRANIRIAKERLEAVDGADAVQEALENEEPIDVSSQYAARDLPAGEYDGEMRHNVEEITRPDSIAILPHQQGQCSIENGCGIDPQLVANAEVSMPMTRANATHDGEDMGAAADAEFEVGDLVRWRTQASPGTGRVARVVTEPGAAVESDADVDEPPTRVAGEGEPVYKLDDWDGEQFVEGQVVKSESELLGRWENAPEEAMQANANGWDVTPVSPDDVDEWTDDEWDGDDAVAAMPNPREHDGAADVLDQTHAAIPSDDGARDAKGNWKLPFRTAPDAPVNTRALVAIDAALSGARGGVDGLSDVTKEAVAEWTRAMLQAAPDDLFGSMDSGQTGNVLAAIGRQVTDALGLTAASSSSSDSDSSQTMPAESGVDSASSDSRSANADPADEPGGTMKDREKLIDEITSNSAITAESLDDACDERVEKLHDDVVANGTANDGGDDLAERLDTIEEKMVTEDDLEAVVANKQSEHKEDELAREIVANSAEYDEPGEVREDYPTVAALETKRDQVTSDEGVPAAGNGLSVNIGESDDESDVDVSSGLLGAGGDD